MQLLSHGICGPISLVADYGEELWTITDGSSHHFGLEVSPDGEPVGAVRDYPNELDSSSVDNSIRN